MTRRTASRTKYRQRIDQACDRTVMARQHKRLTKGKRSQRCEPKLDAGGNIMDTDVVYGGNISCISAMGA